MPLGLAQCSPEPVLQLGLPTPCARHHVAALAGVHDAAALPAVEPTASQKQHGHAPMTLRAAEPGPGAAEVAGGPVESHLLQHCLAVDAEAQPHGVSGR